MRKIDGVAVRLVPALAPSPVAGRPRRSGNGFRPEMVPIRPPRRDVSAHVLGDGLALPDPAPTCGRPPHRDRLCTLAALPPALPGERTGLAQVPARAVARSERNVPRR